MDENLKVDLEPHRRIGMTILTKEFVERRRKILAALNESSDAETAAKRLCDEGLILSRAEGRRLWRVVRSR